MPIPRVLEQRPEVPTDDLGTLGRIDSFAGIVFRLEVGLVLDGQHRHRNAFGAECLDGFRKIVGECRVILRDELSLDEASRRLHPRRRAPRTDHHQEVRVDRQGLADSREDVGPGGGDREIAQLRVRHVPGRVVIAVVVGREVGCADGQPRERKAKSIRPTPEQLRHDRLPLVRGKAAQHLGGSVRHRSAESAHGLKAMRGVDGDAFIADGGAKRRQRWLGRQFLRFVRRRKPHLGRCSGHRLNGRAAGNHERPEQECGQPHHASATAGQYFRR